MVKSDEPTVTRMRNLASALAAYTNRHSLAMMVLGFFSGLPLILIFDTLSAWLRESGVTLQIITFFSLVSLLYAFKFLWAPLVDRAKIPLLHTILGHRRSWMVFCQGLMVLAFLLLAACRTEVREMG